MRALAKELNDRELLGSEDACNEAAAKAIFARAMLDRALGAYFDLSELAETERTSAASLTS